MKPLNSAWGFLTSFFRPLSSEELSWARSKKHFRFIDGLRGISAIVVLIWHYQHFYYSHAILTPEKVDLDRSRQPLYSLLAPFYEHGYWAVQLFWIISGFVFSHVYAAKRVQGRDFVIARFARLYPLHFVTLIAAATLQITSVQLLGGYQIVTHNDWYHFLLHVLFVPQWGFEKGLSFNSPIWSVSIELAIYFLFFLLARRIYSNGILTSALLIIISIPLVQSSPKFWLFALCVQYFFSGVIAYHLISRYEKLKYLIWLLIAASLIHFFNLVHRDAINRHPFNQVEAYVLMPMVLTVAIIDLKITTDMFGKWLDAIGSLTYSTYLWHFPIQIFVLILFNIYNIPRTTFDSPATLCLWLLTMIGIGRLSFLHIEKPAQRFLLRFLAKDLKGKG